MEQRNTLRTSCHIPTCILEEHFSSAGREAWSDPGYNLGTYCCSTWCRGRSTGRVARSMPSLQGGRCQDVTEEKLVLLALMWVLSTHPPLTPSLPFVLWSPPCCADTPRGRNNCPTATLSYPLHYTLCNPPPVHLVICSGDSTNSGRDETMGGSS